MPYPLSLPTVGYPNAITMRARSTVAQSVSLFTGQQQTYVYSGQWWEADVSLPPMARETAEEWIAFLLGLSGMEGTFLMGDLVGMVPRGVATGTPLVKGASQTGKSLITDGWSAGVTNILKAGDYFSLGSGTTTRLYKLTAAVNSNGSGEATLAFWPRLRETPADNAALTVQAAKGTFRLSSNEQSFSIAEAQLYGISFSCKEAI